MPSKTTKPSGERVAGELRLVLKKLIQRLREQGNPAGLTLSQMVVLGRLERDGPATVSTLARAEGMRPQSMGATVETLQVAGLVSGTPDPQDGRQTILTLTAACRKMFREGRAAREDWLWQAMQSHLSAEERATLAQAVTLLQRIANS